MFPLLLEAGGENGTVMLKYEYYRITIHRENIFQMSVGIID
jgi:hypothetical protein